jgi:hypothetical protein
MTSIATTKEMTKTFRGEICGWELYIFSHILQIIPPDIGIQVRMPFNCEGYPRFHEVLDFESNTCKGTFSNSFYTMDVTVHLISHNCELILYQNQNMIPLIYIHSVPLRVGEALHALGNGGNPPHNPILMCFSEMSTSFSPQTKPSEEYPDDGYSSGEAEFSDTEY